MTPKEQWKSLVDGLTASDIISVYSALGFEAESRRPRPMSSGWSQGWRLPPSIKIDKKPSCAINLVHGGFQDFGSDLRGDMLDAIVSARGYDFNGAVSWAYSILARPMPTPIRLHNAGEKWKWYDPEQGEKTAEYQYFDADGKHVYSVDRIEGKGIFHGRKSFPPRAPGATRSGFPAGVDKVLYRLPDVLAAIEQDLPVYLVEGEKDVENMIAGGLVATCNMGGAGNWLPQYTESLRGARVVIVPDNDESGFDHMRVVLDELTGVAKEVCTVLLPGLGPGGDVTDFLESHSVADIADMVDFDSLSGFKYQCRIATDKWLGDYLHQMASQACDVTYRNLPDEMVANVCKTNAVVVTEVRGRLFDKEVKKICAEMSDMA